MTEDTIECHLAPFHACYQYVFDEKSLRPDFPILPEHKIRTWVSISGRTAFTRTVILVPCGENPFLMYVLVQRCLLLWQRPSTSYQLYTFWCLQLKLHSITTSPRVILLNYGFNRLAHQLSSLRLCMWTATPQPWLLRF